MRERRSRDRKTTDLPLSLRAAAVLEMRRRLHSGSGLTRWQEFQARYFDDPTGFVRDCIDWLGEDGASSYQEEILQALVSKKRVSARGPHGLGKSAMASWIVLWFALTRDGQDWKIPTTASAWRQLNKFLWPEIHKWARRLKWDVIGRRPFSERTELMNLNLKLTTGEAFALASDNSDLIEGAHADHLLYIFDESKVIPVATWDSAEGAFSTGNCMWFSISTPGEPNGRFYDIQSRKPGYQDWWVRHVTKKEAISAGRIDPKWAEDRKNQWGEKSAVYQNRVEGNFATSDEDNVILLASVERAIERWHVRNEKDDWKVLTGLGVDIGRGGDKTVIAREYDNCAIASLEKSNDKDVMPVTGRVRGILWKEVEAKAVIDIIGIGAGVYDNLREETRISSRVMPFVASAKTDYVDSTGELHFDNLRSAGWWNMRQLLEEDAYDLPPDDDMIGELTSPKWTLGSNGRIRVEGKDGIRERIGRSTDNADAIIQVAMKKWLRSDDDFGGRGHVENYKSRWTE